MSRQTSSVKSKLRRSRGSLSDVEGKQVHRSRASTSVELERGVTACSTPTPRCDRSTDAASSEDLAARGSQSTSPGSGTLPETRRQSNGIGSPVWRRQGAAGCRPMAVDGVGAPSPVEALAAVVPTAVVSPPVKALAAVCTSAVMSPPAAALAAVVPTAAEAPGSGCGRDWVASSAAAGGSAAELVGGRGGSTSSAAVAGDGCGCSGAEMATLRPQQLEFLRAELEADRSPDSSPDRRLYCSHSGAAAQLRRKGTSNALGSDGPDQTPPRCRGGGSPPPEQQDFVMWREEQQKNSQHQARRSFHKAAAQLEAELAAGLANLQEALRRCSPGSSRDEPMQRDADDAMHRAVAEDREPSPGMHPRLGEMNSSALEAKGGGIAKSTSELSRPKTPPTIVQRCSAVERLKTSKSADNC